MWLRCRPAADTSPSGALGTRPQGTQHRGVISEVLAGSSGRSQRPLSSQQAKAKFPIRLGSWHSALVRRHYLLSTI